MAGGCDTDLENKKVPPSAQTQDRRQTQASDTRVVCASSRSEVVPHESMEKQLDNLVKKPVSFLLLMSGHLPLAKVILLKLKRASRLQQI